MKYDTKLLTRFTLAVMLLCLWSVSARAGNVPSVPVGPNETYIDPVTGQTLPKPPDYNTTANWAFSPPLNKFVDTLPRLGVANNLNQLLPPAAPDTITYPGSDYYEIDLVEYYEQMHSDLPKPGTILRGYVQVNKGTDPSTGLNTVAPPPVHYLGPIIVAQKNRPVRVKFTNRLPSGAGGDLFVPTDDTIMGAGQGPAQATNPPVRGQGAPCDNTVPGSACAKYTQNRSVIHLHGGRTPWISDGTPHQWITPKDENTPFTQGVSTRNVPDMPDPGDGSVTYYWSNQQSARLMFYHEHAFGITRLNPYIGVAAGYVLVDEFELDLINRGVLPPLLDQIPLVIQDRTFVDATPVPQPGGGTIPQIRLTDPLWNWGSGTPDANGIRPPVSGDFWLNHVYMPNQNPYNNDFSGINPFGRWFLGSWFYPPTPVTYPPVPNPYYDPDCASPDPAIYANCTSPGQPPFIPATPHPSVGMESFMDTMIVNGTAFPVLEVDARAYRFRILNASSDRGLNLSWFLADTDRPVTDPRRISPYTEVKMVDAVKTTGWPATWPIDGREGGVPDPASAGPSWIQIGTEGGFLPKPVIRPPQPITWVTDPTAFWFGIVKDMSLGLMAAERADVIVDFTGYEGKTLILYNDGPAAWPALDPRYDYYTDAPDLSDTGGFGRGGQGPQAGQGPNIRTVMQVYVRPTPKDQPYTFNYNNLYKEFIPGDKTVKGLFEKAQEPIIVGQTAYKDVYPNSYFPPNWPWQGVSKIEDNSLSFVTVTGKPVIVPMEPKAMHDEMGATFDADYGRMSAKLGMQTPNPTALNALAILYSYPDIPSEQILNSTGFNVQVLPNPAVPGTYTLADGTQIWKISHNGVDTHPIHFHIFDVQLINRVGWDGRIMLPDANELGWKETIKISPLMDTIVAVRPVAPSLPFGLPNSLRPLNPALPIGSLMGFSQIDWTTGQAWGPNSIYPNGISNFVHDFKWEYVWHCHILSHEEMDMMRSVELNVTNTVSPAPTLNSVTAEGAIMWTDPTPVNYVTGEGFGDSRSEIGFRVERCNGTCTDAQFPLSTDPAYHAVAVLANTTAYTDTSMVRGDTYSYRVFAYNAPIQLTFLPNPVTYTSGDSAPSNIITVTVPKPIAGASPTSLAFGNQVINSASAANNVTLSNTGTGDVIYSTSFGGTNPNDFVLSSTTCGASVAPGTSCSLSVTFLPTAIGSSAASLIINTNDPDHNPLTVTLSGAGIAPPSLPDPPTNVRPTTGTLSAGLWTLPVRSTSSFFLTWTKPANNVQTGYNIFRSSNSGATWTQLNATPIAATTTTYRVTNTPIIAAPYYLFKVQAVNAGGATDSLPVQIRVR